MNTLTIRLTTLLLSVCLCAMVLANSATSPEKEWRDHVLPDGRILSGYWINGVPHGRHTLQDDTFPIFYFHDQGRVIGPAFDYHYDLDDYQGDFDQLGRRQGFGVFTRRSGITATYVGEWVDDYPTGVGAQVLEDGSIHFGYREGMNNLGLFVIVGRNNVIRTREYSEPVEGVEINYDERTGYVEMMHRNGALWLKDDVIYYFGRGGRCEFSLSSRELSCR